MAKGATTTEKPYVPKFAETAMQQGIGMATDLAPLQDTYTPLYGPQVAALSPLEQASMQGTDMMASAFGMPTSGGQSYLPEAQTYEGVILMRSLLPAARAWRPVRSARSSPATRLCRSYTPRAGRRRQGPGHGGCAWGCRGHARRLPGRIRSR